MTTDATQHAVARPEAQPDTTHVVLVTLPSGNKALYECDARHLPREGAPESTGLPMECGRQIAHELDGDWFHPGGWVRVCDTRTLDLVILHTPCAAAAPIEHDGDTWLVTGRGAVRDGKTNCQLTSMTRELDGHTHGQARVQIVEWMDNDVLAQAQRPIAPRPRG